MRSDRSVLDGAWSKASSGVLAGQDAVCFGPCRTVREQAMHVADEVDEYRNDRR